MFQRVILVAFIAGTLAGGVVSLAQAWWTTPLILVAERYETAEVDASGESHGAPHTHDAASASPGATHSHAPHAPAAGATRLAMTVLTNVLTGIGFGLLLSGCLLLYGRPVGALGGLIWGVAGFAVFALAPALGLPPELPGQVAADLGARQAWWLFATSGTAAGLALLVLGPRWWLRPLGLLLIMLPHVTGAPQPPPGATGGPPAELIRDFITASLFTAALFWLVLGAAAGGINAWLLRRERAGAQPWRRA